MRHFPRTKLPIAILAWITIARAGVASETGSPPSREPASCVVDVPHSQIPAWIVVVGTVNGGSQPDPAGLVTIITRDFADNPMSHQPVVIDFSACCDLVLCSSGVGHECAARTVRGITDNVGQFSFTVMGAARDPGGMVPPAQFGGGGLGDVVIRSGCNESTVIGHATAIVLDQDGAAGGSAGTSGSDVVSVVNLYGSVALGAPYRGRGDLDADGTISGADVAAMIGHLGRLALVGGGGCASLCIEPACP